MLAILWRAGEVAHQLRPLAGLPEDTGLVPSAAHMMTSIIQDHLVLPTVPSISAVLLTHFKYNFFLLFKSWFILCI